MSFGDATWKSRTAENKHLGGGEVKPPKENMMNDNKSIKERLTDRATVAKDRLIEIMDELENEGFHRKAQSLGTIIEKLERWQNTQ